jgi:hypothetical protein
MPTPEQIERAKNEVFRKNGAQMRDDTADIFAAVIEAEISKQDTALIRRLLNALVHPGGDLDALQERVAVVKDARERLKP